ncbi:putative ATP-grasp-modified RiPP [Kitasatospora sp. NPDC001574]
MTTQTLDRPFGLTLAVPVIPSDRTDLPELTLCPDRQIGITASGAPYIHTPDMTTQTTTSTSITTTEDSQSWPDSDTAPVIDN